MAQVPKPFVIEGQLINAPQQYVYFQGEGISDSCLIDTQGYFTFKGENTEELEYRIKSKLPYFRNVSLAVHNQKIKLFIDGKNKETWQPLGNIKIENSPSSYELNYNIRVITNSYAKQFRVLLACIDSLSTSGDNLATMNKQKELDKARTNWFYDNKKNADTTFSPVTAFNLIIIMEAVVGTMPENEQLKKDVSESYKIAKDRFTKSTLIQGLYQSYVKLNAVTSTFVNLNDLPFKLADRKGKLVDYQEFKGKLLLIDFWASWCKPCREEHPTIKKAFDTYGGEKFTIVSISIDKEKDYQKWIDAINVDNVGKWTHLINNLTTEYNVLERYAINAIPSNMLIATDGTILERNLRGHRLLEAVGKHIK